MPVPHRSPDLPPPFGVNVTNGGAEISVYAHHADAVEVCLFDGPGAQARERRVELTQRTHGIWFGHVEGLTHGSRYGLRVHGPYEPFAGHRHNPAKLLLDPYAAAIEGAVTWRPEVFGHVVDETLRGDGQARDDRDSAPYVPRGVVIDHSFDWGGDRPPLVPWSETLVYEAHVRGLTRLHPEVPEHLRGTYAGMAHPAVIEHLRRLGVTTVELLPLHTFTTEPNVARRGLSNYWGYNTLGFFAPHAGYAAATAPQGVVDEVKGMVKALHAAGIEVLLDVVYNHTAEQGAPLGATLSWRGLDAECYYRLDHRGNDIDFTGCGNSVDLRHPIVCRMVLDSLRMWVEQYHVDGFRFDLAPVLARNAHDDFDPSHPFLVALRTDPVLNQVKLVAEPWDCGAHGWRTGQFPPPFAEWNDVYRDSVRTFWLPDVARAREGGTGRGVRDLATRLAGSRDLFDRFDRGPLATVNLITAHDGFTAYDLTAYDRKHNEANGEDGRDGTDDNRSRNHGVEGPAPAEIMEARARSVRNLLGTLLVSTGIPMLVAGDEMGRTQEGNNNAYCQDGPLSWVSWDLAPWQAELLETVRWLTALRRTHGVLQQRRFFPDPPVAGDGIPALLWFSAAGVPMTVGDWDCGATRTVSMLLESEQHAIGSDAEQPARLRSLLVVFHGGAEPGRVVLPVHPDVSGYVPLWDSALAVPGAPGAAMAPGSVIEPSGPSLRIFAVRH